ncbi:hypothetical protein GCM10009817_20810 [Terrabacter lapilli]|uniref:ATP-binding protein n=1 Tax=Terrabacter lapilli TaxID=436231 RepID=A0ABN2S4B9_9MICO
MVSQLTEAELERALEPVRKHFYGANVNVNTVLSAHLRAAGLQPSGQTWQVAKFAVDSGETFTDAVLLVGGKPVEAEPPASGETPHTQTDVSAGNTIKQRSAVHAAPATAVAYDQTDAAHARLQPTVHTPAPELQSTTRLTWFPKRFGVGDIDGEGAQRLLGTPDLAPVSVLVRETAQNSWDARLRGQELEFTMNLRLLTPDEIQILRERVFTSDAGPIPVAATLDRGETWALEVSDRGAKGLGGPVRNDLAIPEGQRTDFIDLVLNIGSPRDVHLGAGTYGFGKTIAYTTSGVGTVLLWSRTEHEGAPQHRLIASAFGPSFEKDGLRYTGRHWWGEVPAGRDRVEPLVGKEAAALGENLFARHFHGEETGTSLLILDPVLGGDDRESDANSLVEAALWHLWPKLVDPSRGRDRMRISVQLNGRPLRIPEPAAHPVLSAFVDALSAVRRAQGEGGPEPVNPTEVIAIEMLKPIRTLGHLAVTRFPKVEWEATAKEIVPLNEPVSHVALMRHDAELLVRYWERPTLNSPSLQWCAVFKPALDADDAFALSEPPSHDDWVTSSVKDKGLRQVVNVALRRIREHVNEMLAPDPPTIEGTGQGAPSVAELADSLASLMGPVSGSAPDGRRTSSRHLARRAEPRVVVGEQILGSAADGHRLIALECTLQCDGEAHRVTADVRVGVEGGVAEASEEVRALGWTDHRPDLEGPQLDLELAAPLLEPGQAAWFVAEVTDDLLADIDIRISKEKP